MKPQKNERLIPILSILRKGKWDEYYKLGNLSKKLYNSVRKNPNRYSGVCIAVPEKIADKLGFIWKI